MEKPQERKALENGNSERRLCHVESRGFYSRASYKAQIWEWRHLGSSSPS
jgi:hypothetical protein